MNEKGGLMVDTNLQLEVDDTTKDLRGKIIEGHLLVRDLIDGGLDLKPNSKKATSVELVISKHYLGFIIGERPVF